METTLHEIAALEKISPQQAESQFQALNDLELALVGGGHGDIILG